MKNTLVLTKKQTYFLKENRQDPITGDNFQLGDEVVFCAECQSAFLIESWEYMGNQHCNQRKTLSKIPKIKNLDIRKRKKVRKTLKNNYQIPRGTDVWLCWSIDTFIWLLLNFIFWQISKNYWTYSIEYHKWFAIFSLLLKDNNLIITSFGKLLGGMTIIYTKTHKKISPILFPLRHSIAALTLLLALFAYNQEFILTITILLFFICILDLPIQIDKSRKIIDYILGTAIRKNQNEKGFDGIHLDFPSHSSTTTTFENGYQDPTLLDEF